MSINCPAGGGGNGSGNGSGTAGTANTGGGGGGSSKDITGGAGGSGIVIVRYLTNSLSAFKITQQDANTVRLYNYSGAAQNLRLDVITGGLGRNAGTVSLAPAAADTDSQESGNAIWVNKTGDYGNLIKLQGDGTDKFGVDWVGHATIAATLKIGQGSTLIDHNSITWSGGAKLRDNAGKLELQASGTGTGSTGTGSIYFLNSSGAVRGRFDTSGDATGGTITYSDGYTIHTFTSSGTFTPPGNTSGTVEYLVVGGGGGGGSVGGAGGGAGGFRTATGFAVTAQAYTVTVGGGGAGSPNDGTIKGSSGSDSLFSTITSTGGGGGGSNNTANGLNGGSGGGARAGGTGGTGNTPSTSPSQGNNGAGAALDSGGGGGGATAVGGTGTGDNGGAGGAGTASSISGASVTYAGGGGGGSRTAGSGGAGGSGIVIVRYLTGTLGGYGRLYLGSTNTTSADLAEYYISGDDSITAGDVVAISNEKVVIPDPIGNPDLDPRLRGDDKEGIGDDKEVETKGVLRKAEKPYDSKLIGIISTNPGVLMGSIDGENKADKRMLALSGRVPVKIDLDSEPIAVGDFLTSSDKPGLAKKATKAGYTVGKALESWSCTTSEESKATSEVTGTGSSDGGTCQDRIEAFVNLGYFAGELTEDGFLNNGGSEFPLVTEQAYFLSEALGGTPSDSFRSSKDQAPASTSGAITATQDSSATPSSVYQSSSLSANLSRLSDWIKENWDSLSRQNTDLLQSLWVKTGIVSTEVLSPLSSESSGISVELGPTQTFGIYNKEGTPAAIFDDQGNATLAGTLYADRIVTKFGDLDARLSELIEATRSATPTRTPDVETESTLDATSSALLALLSQDVTDLKEQLSTSGVEGLYTPDVNAGHLIDDTILIDKTGISTISDPPSPDGFGGQSTLYLQPAKLGNLDIIGGTIVVNTAGDVVINGNLAIRGVLGVNTIKPLDGFADLVFDATGAARFTGDIIASGTGVFRDIAVSASASGTLSVGAGESIATVSGIYTSGVMISVTPSWDTTVWVATKSADAFTLNFGTPPSSAEATAGKASADWLIIRRQ